LYIGYDSIVFYPHFHWGIRRRSKILFCYFQANFMEMEHFQEKDKVTETTETVRNYLVKEYHRRYALLKTSWSFQTRQFFDNTTLHGVRYINEPNRPFCENVGAVATMVVIVALWEKFQNNPTLTGLDTNYHSWEVKFPAITICPLNPVDNIKLDEYRLKIWGDKDANSKYKDLLTDIANMSYYNLQNFRMYSDKINLTANDLEMLSKKINATVADLRDLQEQLLLKCENFLQNCVYKGTPFECCERFIYAHSAEEIPIVEIHPLHIWRRDIGKILFSDKETYTTADSRQLTIKQRKCVFPEEIPLETDSYYTFSGGYDYCDLQGLGCLAEFSHMFEENGMKCDCTFACLNHVSVCMTFRNVEELEDLQYEYDKRERDVLDLSLVPTFCRSEKDLQAAIKIGHNKEIPLVLKPKTYHQIHTEEKSMGITDRIHYQE
ncbi:hypothetical protein C0J52_16367, partial [Blattella germanica]